MSKILVTGGGGFIGSHLVDRLLEEGDQVTALDTHLNTPRNLIQHEDRENFQYVKGDITDRRELETIITEDFDEIFHLAAIVGVEEYCKYPLKTIDVNFGGTRNVLDIALKKEVKLIFSSTSEIYGKNTNVPWDEEADRVLGSTSIDRWSYSTSKSLCEHMLFAAHREYGLPMVIIRYFNVYGPRQRPQLVIPAMIKNVLENKNPIVYDTGKQTRCFTYIKDAVEGTLKASSNKDAEGKSFNIGSDVETSIMDIARLIIKISGKGSKIKIEHVNTKNLYSSYEDLTRRIPNIEKSKRILNWEPSTTLRKGIRKTYKWYLESSNYIL